MRQNRVTQGLVVGAAAAALLVAGCKKDEEESGSKGESGAEESAAESSGDGESGASGGGAAAVAMPDSASYTMFPADSEVLFGVSFEPVRKSALWKKYRDQVVQNLDTEGDFDEFNEACGFDPLSKLQRVMFGGSSADEDGMVAVVQGFTRDEVKTCGEGVAKLEDKELTVEDDGDLSKYAVGEEEIWVAWIDDDTLLTGPRAETDKEWLRARAAGEEGLAEDSELAELVQSDIDRSGGVWFGMIPSEDSPMGGGMAMGGGPQPEAIFGAVAPTDGISIDAGLRFASADEAKQVLEQANQMLQMVKMQAGELGKFVEKTEMTTEETDMLVSLSLSEKELNQLVQGVGAMMGGMMGGGMGGGGMGGGGMGGGMGH